MCSMWSLRRVAGELLHVIERAAVATKDGTITRGSLIGAAKQLNMGPRR